MYGFFKITELSWNVAGKGETHRSLLSPPKLFSHREVGSPYQSMATWPRAASLPERHCAVRMNPEHTPVQLPRKSVSQEDSGLRYLLPVWLSIAHLGPPAVH